MTDGRPDDGLGTNGGTGLDVTRPHSARVWNYWVGGKDNFAAEQVAAAHPDVRLAVRRSGRSWPGGGVPGHACGRLPPAIRRGAGIARRICRGFTSGVDALHTRFGICRRSFCTASVQEWSRH